MSIRELVALKKQIERLIVEAQEFGTERRVRILREAAREIEQQICEVAHELMIDGAA